MTGHKMTGRSPMTETNDGLRTVVYRIPLPIKVVIRAAYARARITTLTP
jgi:hypothetical protein